MWHPAEYLGLHCHTGKMSYGEQGNLLESKMSRRVSLGCLPAITPFSNSRALISQFSHLTPEKTEGLRGQVPGPMSHNCLVAKPGVETWSPEAQEKLIPLTEIAGRFLIACWSSSFDSGCENTVLRRILRPNIYSEVLWFISLVYLGYRWEDLLYFLCISSCSPMLCFDF